MFSDIFHQDFNLSFGNPRSDICGTCKQLVHQIKSSLNTEEKEAEHELHLRKAAVFQDALKEKADDRVLKICFDFQKNLALPITNLGEEYYKRQLYIYNLGMHNLSNGSATMYLYSETFGRKTANEVISSLQHFIEHHKEENHSRLELFADNCFAQNKNKILWGYLEHVAKSEVFSEIVIFYPIPGHVIMSVDSDFGAIEKRRRRFEKVQTPR